MRQPSSVVTEQMTGMEHKIEPANLAHRIIQIRADMAHTMAKFPRRARALCVDGWMLLPLLPLRGVQDWRAV